MVIERPRGQSAVWHRFCPVSRYPIDNPSFHQRAWVLWKDDHGPREEEAGLSSEMPVVVSGTSTISICLPDLDLWRLVPLLSAGAEATLPAEYCREVEPGAVCELPVPLATPSSREQLPEVGRGDRARLWGPALRRMAHILSDQICAAQGKNTFCGKGKKVLICGTWVGWGGETLIWDCVDLERWSCFREQLQVDKTKNDICPKGHIQVRGIILVFCSI